MSVRRTRSWEKRHRAHAYRVPGAMAANALQARRETGAIAEQLGVGVDDVAKALAEYSLAVMDDWGLIESDDYDGQAEEKSVFLGYRWGSALHSRVVQAAEFSGRSMGAMALALILSGLAAYRDGLLFLSPVAIRVEQSVVAEWASER